MDLVTRPIPGLTCHVCYYDAALSAVLYTSGLAGDTH